jgi:predicted TIM-barrel fold metal-dependent hydrolase
MDRSIPFIDTSHHLWDLTRFRYDWLSEPLVDDQTADLSDYRMIRSTIGQPKRLFREFYGANVTKSVHVEAGVAGDSVLETVWLDAVHRELGFPNALVVFCDLASPNAESELERHLAASTLTRGVRLRSHPDDATTPRFLEALRMLVRHNLSYELMPGPGKMLSAAAAARAVPGVQIIVGHAGLPLERSDAYFAAWAREIDALAKLDNAACKVSGFGMTDHAWTVDSIRRWVLHCIEAFGPRRVMFGTNWPVDILYATYLEQTDAYRQLITGFSRDEQENMLHRNAERLYRIDR